MSDIYHKLADSPSLVQACQKITGEAQKLYIVNKKSRKKTGARLKQDENRKISTKRKIIIKIPEQITEKIKNQCTNTEKLYWKEDKIWYSIELKYQNGIPFANVPKSQQNIKRTR